MPYERSPSRRPGRGPRPGSPGRHAGADRGAPAGGASGSRGAKAGPRKPARDAQPSASNRAQRSRAEAPRAPRSAPDRRFDASAEAPPRRAAPPAGAATAAPAASAPAAGVAHVVATADDAGQRLDNWLLRRMKGVPKSHVYRILRKGEVRVNGKRAKPEYRVEAGDDVRLPPVRSAEQVGPTRVPDALIRSVEACIVHQDDDVIALAKPPGLAVHGGSGLSLGVIEALRASRPDESLELVHRLDRDTSGLLLVARNRRSLRTLHALIREGRFDKQYLALVKGPWNFGRKTIDVPLDVRGKQGGERMVKVREGGKASESTFEPVDFYGPTATLMRVDIATGRTHQIRVHAAFAGHPIAGDEKYGDREFNERMKELGLGRMFLHAHAVSFEWPGTGKQFAVSVPLPPELAAVVERLTTSRRKRRR